MEAKHRRVYVHVVTPWPLVRTAMKTMRYMS